MSTTGAAEKVPLQPLRMRACRIYSERSKVVRTHVHCPRTGQVREISDCMQCTAYGGVSFSMHNGQSEANLLCREPRRTPKHEPGPTSVADSTPIWTIMKSDVYCVRRDVTLDRAMALLLEAGIGGLPVVDSEAFPEGMLSKTDLVRWFREKASGGARSNETVVADVMTPLAFTLPAEVPISHAAALMSIEGVHRLPIVANNGKVIGIVSALDVVRFLAKNDGYLPRE